jgi:hypothetical protein
MIPPNTTSNQLIGAHDLMATVAALIGETLPEDQARDSFNFLPVFLGTIGDESPVRDHIIMEADKLDGVPVAWPGTLHFGYREGPWKLVFDPDQNVMGLYNLATDLGETVDLKDDPNEADRIEWMVTNFQSLHAAARTAPLLDSDLDGLPDIVETSPGIGTDPLDADSDDDGLTDGFEVNYDAPPPDTYTEGLDTDPLDPDTDADGFLDGMELAAGHNPLLGSDSPVWGDTDDNGVVNAADVMLLTRAVLGLTALADDQKARVDIAPVIAGTPTPNNQVTLGDVVVVEQILLGLASYP